MRAVSSGSVGNSAGAVGAGLPRDNSGHEAPPTCKLTQYRAGLVLLSLILAPLAWGAAPPGTLRVAAVSSKCVPGEVEANLESHVRWTERAVAQGARFVGFPECSITGYDFSAGAGIELDGAEVRAIVELAKKREIYLAAGLVERREGKRFNTQVLAGPKGLLGVMRKVNLTRTERPFFTAGAEFPVFDLDGVKVAIAICADATQFETVHLLALRGAQMIFVPHATFLQGTPQSWFEWRTDRWGWFAKDCGVFLVGCNNAGRFETARSGEIDLRFASGALVTGPDGTVVRRSEPATNTETMILVDISTAGLDERRAELPAFSSFAKERFFGELVRDPPHPITPAPPR